MKKRLSTYLTALPGLLPQYAGKYALVCDGDVTIYETADEAMQAVPADCEDGKRFLIIRVEPLPADFSLENWKRTEQSVFAIR